ncbi:MAG TPA: CoA transferase [Terrimesophilobacter sp.]|nr:CoA transferase [Terrimesophilobacter sp.]HRP98847.1 CoA transferase [Terrimesophilobacter sp.]
MSAAEALPLAGVRVLDFSTLVPGPLATLLLSEAGADVVKVERPGDGDEMRSYTPRIGSTSANYSLINRGKRAYGIDLKDAAARDRVLELAAEADVVIEQFRPGVMDRLGLGFDDVRAKNPRTIYCSITGHGQYGPKAGVAGHDLTYLAESGLLSVVHDSAGAPSLPPTVIADIAGGTYPAVINILLALRRRDVTGEGARLDISMARNLNLLAYGYLASAAGGAGWPRPGGELLTGGSPRYRIYKTSDSRHLAVAALEERFWVRFTTLVGLPPQLVDDAGQEERVIGELARIVGTRTAAEWSSLIDGEDVCVSVVLSMEEAAASGGLTVDDPGRLVEDDRVDVGRLVTPIDGSMMSAPDRLSAPVLMELPDDGQIWH